MWPFRRGGEASPLLYQASIRLLLTLAVAILAIGLLMGWVIQLSQVKAAQREIQAATEYFSDAVKDMERRGEEAAIRFRSRLEFMRMLEEPRERWIKLNSYLTTQTAGEAFTAMLVTDARNRVQFSYGFGEDGIPGEFASPPDIGWYFHQRDEQLYRYYVQHVWLGAAEGMGHLILFRRMDHGLLHQMATPNTHLFLRRHGQTLATSLGEPGKSVLLPHHGGPLEHDGMRVEQRSISWSADGADSADNPELVVHRQIESLFDSREVLLGLAAGLAGLFAALWASVGVWVYRTTRRIASLGLASRQFLQDGHPSAALDHLLGKAQRVQDDEINEVARSLGSLTDTVAQRDVERDAYETSLRESQARVLEITSVLADGVYVLDRDGLVTFANLETERLLGWTAAELLGRNGHDTFHYKKPDGTPISAESCPVHLTIRTGRTYRANEDWLVRRDGSIIPVSIVSSPILRDGVVTGSVAAFHDITQRLEAQKALRESEKRFRDTIEYAPIGMGIAALDGRFQQVNRALCNILGYEKEELEQLTFAQVTHPEDLDTTLTNVQGLLNGDIDSYQMEKRYIRKNGQSVWVQLTVSLLRDDGGAPLYFIGQVEDISGRKLAEQALHESEERFRLIGTVANEGIVILGAGDRVVYWNPAAEKTFGYSASEVLDHDLHDLIAPARFRENFRQGFEHFSACGAGPLIGKTLEIEALRKDGTEIPVELSISALQIKGQWHALGIVRDITERKQLERELLHFNQTLAQQVKEEVAKNMERERVLIHQSRLAAMGEMIGNIAHQWRQPINALGLLLANLKDAYEYRELDQEYLDRSVASGKELIQRMSATIDDFRDFFKPNKVKQGFQPWDGIEDAIKLANHSFKVHNIEIELDKSGAPCLVLGYPNEFAQVVLNALSNAKEAIVEKNLRGKVRIRVEKGADSATISIRDNGGGISAEALPQVFDPYFTTKEKGTGIGLYMSKMIMDNMNGGIAIRNADDGAEMRLTLPLAGEPAIIP